MGKKRATRKPWSAAEDENLREAYPHRATCDLTAEFGRSVTAIYGRARTLGLGKSEAFLASPEAHRLDVIKGGATRFKKGHKPHNAGLKGWQAGGRAAATKFKKGQRSVNWKPIGSERVCDGVVQRKILDTGYPPHDWVAKHALIWIEQNGPIPDGHMVIFRDGDRSNFDPANLECISRAENMRRNTLHRRYPKPIVEAIMLRAAVVRKINRRLKHEKQDR